MNDLQIDYFMAVATNLSFTKTSEELFVSQPAISKQISLMEKELGVKLFIRNNKKTTLTKAGELYYEFFREYKKELRDTMYKAAALQQQDPEVIHVGFMEGWDLAEILPEVLRRFHDKYPNTRLAIDCCGVKELTTLLLTDNIQVALTMKNSLTDFNELYQNTVATTRKLLIYSPANEHAGAPDVNPSDFRHEKFFAPWEIVGKMITRVLTTYCEPYGFTPEIEFVHNSESVITCVRNNMGVAIVDDWVWCIHSPTLRYIELEAVDEICVTRMKEGVNEQTLFLTELLEDVVKSRRS